MFLPAGEKALQLLTENADLAGVRLGRLLFAVRGIDCQVPETAAPALPLSDHPSDEALP